MSGLFKLYLTRDVRLYTPEEVRASVEYRVPVTGRTFRAGRGFPVLDVLGSQDGVRFLVQTPIGKATFALDALRPHAHWKDTGPAAAGPTNRKETR